MQKHPSQISANRRNPDQANKPPKNKNHVQARLVETENNEKLLGITRYYQLPNGRYHYVCTFEDGVEEGFHTLEDARRHVGCATWDQDIYDSQFSGQTDTAEGTTR